MAVTTSVPRVELSRTGHLIEPNLARVILKPHLPGGWGPLLGSATRVRLLFDRILAIPDERVPELLADVRAGFGDRHRDLDALLLAHHRVAADQISQGHDDGHDLSLERRLLVGAYFSQEYAIEGASLSNPSIVAAPDQAGVPQGSLRFVMSMRSIGEGHVSCIQFRTGEIDAVGQVTLDECGPHAMTGERRPGTFKRSVVHRRMSELGADLDVVDHILEDLDVEFGFEELDLLLGPARTPDAPQNVLEAVTLLHWYASSNYITQFPDDSHLSERVLAPAGPTESHGMEDARFVRLDDGGRITYYATYTAFDGRKILPQLITTRDFREFRIRTMVGRRARNKGIALFPRRIDGQFVALSRHDQESIFVMRSSDPRIWEEAELVRGPTADWELVQIGNCGSPLETDEGWLVITHGVGPMRRYQLGAFLLDLEDPRKVTRWLEEPLLAPSDDERNGYVPNVVYSCGSLIHNGQIVLPYGISDRRTGIGTVSVDSVLGAMQRA